MSSPRFVSFRRSHFRLCLSIETTLAGGFSISFKRVTSYEWQLCEKWQRQLLRGRRYEILRQGGFAKFRCQREEKFRSDFGVKHQQNEDRASFERTTFQARFPWRKFRRPRWNFSEHWVFSARSTLRGRGRGERRFTERRIPDENYLHRVLTSRLIPLKNIGEKVRLRKRRPAIG